MAGGKAGAAGGIVVALGIGLARFGDDCASAGLRGARLADDAAEGALGAGRRMHWGPDDAAGLGRGADEALALRGGAAAHDGFGVAGRMPADGWPETVFEGGLELGVEVVRYGLELPGDIRSIPSVAQDGKTTCPRPLDLTRGDEAWVELVGGLGIACAPIVVIGVADEDRRSLVIEGQPRALASLASECARLGARCMFVGCPATEAAACVEDTETSLFLTRRVPSLPAYARNFTAELVAQDHPPVFVAHLADDEGKARLAVARVAEPSRDH